MGVIKILYDITQELSKIDLDTRLLLLRFLVRAGKSPNPNTYVKQRLQRILDEDDRPVEVSSPRQVNYPYREVKKGP